MLCDQGTNNGTLVPIKREQSPRFEPAQIFPARNPTHSSSDLETGHPKNILFIFLQPNKVASGPNKPRREITGRTSRT